MRMGGRFAYVMIRSDCAHHSGDKPPTYSGIIPPTCSGDMPPINSGVIPPTC